MNVEKDRDKPRANMTAWDYFLQTCFSEFEKVYPMQEVSDYNFQKAAKNRWEEMTDREKKIFHMRADRDKLRHDNEMATYVPMAGDGGKRAVKRKGRDDPIRPPSAFFLFCGCRRGEVMKPHPLVAAGDIANTLARMWSECPPAEKVKYDVLAKSAEEKYTALVDVNKDEQQRKLSGAKKPRKEPSSSSGSDSSDGDSD